MSDNNIIWCLSCRKQIATIHKNDIEQLEQKLICCSRCKTEFVICKFVRHEN